MKKDIIISIRPEFVDKIFSGEKKFEFRRTIPKSLSDKSIIYIYESRRSKKVIGQFRCFVCIMNVDPIELWLTTRVGAGIDYTYYMNYFEGASQCYALSINNLVIFKEPKLLSDFGVNGAPQSYCYVREINETR